MRLFGYITVFVDDGRTIWHCARWGRGGPQCEVHALWGRGALTVAAHHCCCPTRGRGGPSPVGSHYRGPARGRGGSDPTIGPPVVVLLKGRVGLVVMVDDKGP
jgi:hypothetical protein